MIPKYEPHNTVIPIYERRAHPYTFIPLANQTTAAHLLQRGRTTLVVLVRSTGLRSNQVRDALFALIQHNLVTYAMPSTTTSTSVAAASANTRRTPVAPTVHYALDLERALSIVRYPRAVALCREIYGEMVGLNGQSYVAVARSTYF